MLYRTLDPWRQINDIQREMNRLFDASSRTTRYDYPAINIWTDTDKALVTAELPGYDKNDVDISLTGEVKLPFAIDTKNVEAAFQSGILNISLHRAEEDKPKKIEIHTK